MVEKFSTVGLGMITVVNESYCKKLLFVLPVKHTRSNTTKLRKKLSTMTKRHTHLGWGAPVTRVWRCNTIAPMVKHSFASDVGCVLEEISTTHSGSDSYYVDESINKNKDPKHIRLDLK